MVSICRAVIDKYINQTIKIFLEVKKRFIMGRVPASLYMFHEYGRKEGRTKQL
jgi:hypothetical protein